MSSQDLECASMEAFDFRNVALPRTPNENASRRRRFTHHGQRPAMRLFKLFPGKPTDTLMGTISLRGPDDSYDALSYYWGSTHVDGRRPSMRILHNHRTCRLSITPNLESALKHLRSSDETRSLWVDALCINQDDQLEKSEQISVMDRIFTQADTVRIWLGAETPDKANAVAFVKRLVDLQHFESLVTETWAENWAALTRLMRTDWFSRRWIVQEIAYSRAAVVHCGSLTLDWQDMADAVALFASRESDIARLVNQNHALGNVEVGHVEALPANRLVRTVGKVFRKSDDGMGLDRLMSLESLVSNLSEFKASSPHDTIYSLLSLADNIITSTASSEVRQRARSSSMVAAPRNPTVDDTAPALPTGLKQLIPPALPNGSLANGITHSPAGTPIIEHDDRQLGLLELDPDGQPGQIVHEFVELMHKRVDSKTFHVDYSKSWFDVCKDFVSFAITQSCSLDILCRPWAPDRSSLPEEYRNEYLPSWICQFSKSPFSETYDGNYSRVNAEPLATLPDLGKPPYRAAGTTDASRARFGDPLQLENPQHLITPGFVLDVVADMCDPAIEGAVPDDWLSVGGWTDPDALPPDSFWRILVGDRDAEGRNPPSYFRRACLLAFKRRARNGSLNTGLIIQGETSKHMIDFVHRMRAVVFMRRYLKTQREKLPGLVPRATRPGDLICILRGCTVPVVLRPVRDDGTPVAVPLNGGCASDAFPDLAFSPPPAAPAGPPQPNGPPSVRVSAPAHHRARSGARSSSNPLPRPKVHCLLVGECYIHGMMDGEAFTWKSQRRQRTEPRFLDFELH